MFSHVHFETKKTSSKCIHLTVRIMHEVSSKSSRKKKQGHQRRRCAMVAPASATQRAARKVLSTCRRTPASTPFLFLVAPAFEFVWLAVFVGAGACKVESGKLGGVIDPGGGSRRQGQTYRRSGCAGWSGCCGGGEVVPDGRRCGARRRRRSRVRRRRGGLALEERRAAIDAHRLSDDSPTSADDFLNGRGELTSPESPRH